MQSGQDVKLSKATTIASPNYSAEPTPNEHVWGVRLMRNRG